MDIYESVEQCVHDVLSFLLPIWLVYIRIQYYNIIDILRLTSQKWLEMHFNHPHHGWRKN